MHWHLSIDGQIIGPYDDDFVVQAIERGLPTSARIRPLGDSTWRPLDGYPPFARAIRRSAPTIPPPRSTPPPGSEECTDLAPETTNVSTM
jgi:hypothetical protein